MRNFDINNFITKHITKRSESLLTTDLTTFNHELSNKLNNKHVLVIGGAGTIGSWYIKAILKFNIAKLVVVDINENSLTELIRDIRSSNHYNLPSELITYPVNYADKVFEKILDHHGPFEIVANFAAHKHVRSEKDIFSVESMLENNIFRAQELINKLPTTQLEHFFCVSTDKAANPVNIMGASKKIMEELIMAYSQKIPVTTARFANVAFSNGSLLQGFIERISKKQPLSCPTDIRRYFVSPQESGEICLLASILGKTGQIFFPKLTPDKDLISLDKIALNLLNELGYTPDICESEDEARYKASQLIDKTSSYPICLNNSDTSGEKCYEEFFTENEQIDNDLFFALGVIKNHSVRNISEINRIVDILKKLFSCKTVQKNDIVAALQEYMPNFDHIETGKGLDTKM